MARAKRHYIPGYVWHITHRCHKREFLLKFPRDRRRWIDWLYQAKKRYSGLSVLDYMVTSNHVHLLVFDNGGRTVIPDSIKLTAGRTGQENNIRKSRKGGLLGGSLSRNGCGKKSLFKAMYHLHRYEYGSCRCGRASRTMGVLRI